MKSRCKGKGLIAIAIGIGLIIALVGSPVFLLILASIALIIIGILLLCS